MWHAKGDGRPVIKDYPELDEARWRVWVEKGRRHDKAVLARQRMLLILLCVIAASTLVYLVAVPR
jgi:hypothetical protein